MSIFLVNSAPAWSIAVDGLPWFALGITCFTLNIVLIGYEQSMERASSAIAHMLLRGMLLLVPAFVLLPTVMGNHGLWLTVPITEGIVTVVILTHWWLCRQPSHKPAEQHSHTHV